MTLIEKLRKSIQEKVLPPIFKISDFKDIGIVDRNDNIYNYDKKKRGTKNNRVLISTKIGNATYFTFDEKLFSS